MTLFVNRWFGTTGQKHRTVQRGHSGPKISPQLGFLIADISQSFCYLNTGENGDGQLVVKRIVVDIKAEIVEEVRSFYSQLFGLQTVMEQGWIVTLSSGETSPVQVSIATEGGSGTPVPDLSIEVDDVDAVYSQAKDFGYQITYDLIDEPWGVRRFFMSDPTGKVLNVLSH